MGWAQAAVAAPLVATLAGMDFDAFARQFVTAKQWSFTTNDFDPNQPRDGRGRWTDGPGGAGGSGGSSPWAGKRAAITKALSGKGYTVKANPESEADWDGPGHLGGRIYDSAGKPLGEFEVQIRPGHDDWGGGHARWGSTVKDPAVNAELENKLFDYLDKYQVEDIADDLDVKSFEQSVADAYAFDKDSGFSVKSEEQMLTEALPSGLSANGGEPSVSKDGLSWEGTIVEDGDSDNEPVASWSMDLEQDEYGTRVATYDLDALSLSPSDTDAVERALVGTALRGGAQKVMDSAGRCRWGCADEPKSNRHEFTDGGDEPPF